MDEAITYCGDPGSVAVVKLVNNYIPAVSNVVTAEGSALDLQSGVSQEVMVEVIVPFEAMRILSDPAVANNI